MYSRLFKRAFTRRLSRTGWIVTLAAVVNGSLDLAAGQEPPAAPFVQFTDDSISDGLSPLPAAGYRESSSAPLPPSPARRFAQFADSELSGPDRSIKLASYQPSLSEGGGADALNSLNRRVEAIGRAHV